MNSIVRRMNALAELERTNRKFKRCIEGMTREAAYKFYLENQGKFHYNTEETKTEFAAMNYKRCSFCTQVISNYFTEMTVEHIETKRDCPEKIFQWDNLLCACRTCNTKRGTKKYEDDKYLNPTKRTDIERFFRFKMDGTIEAGEGLSAAERKCAEYMLKMYGLDREELNADRREFLLELLDDDYFHRLMKKGKQSRDIHFLAVFTYYKRRKEDGKQDGK